jgi:uncharacterized SAM-binding protein YcdF (DUF218 family)
MNELFFYSAKILWMLLSPDNLFLILLIISLLLILFRHHKKGVTLLSLLTLGLLLLAVFPFGDWMLYPLESRFQTNPELPQNIDGIIVLGGSVVADRSRQWSQLETNQYHERLDYFIKLARQYPQARLIFTGGNSSVHPDEPTEAEMVKDYFIESGIEASRLMLEDRARNTAENAQFSKQLAQPKPAENWVLITTAYHMPRSVGVFCQQDWNVIPYPVDHFTQGAEDLYSPGFSLIYHANNLVLAAHEWLGLLAYYLAGKTPELVPAGCQAPSLNPQTSS